MRTPTEAPDAPVVWVSGGAFSVQCPYCSQAHRHERRNVPLKGRARLSPGCGLRLGPTERVAGYWITIPTN